MSKARMDRIERHHCRYWFGHFKRRSMIVSRHKEIVGLIMALFGRFRVNGDVADVFALDRCQVIGP